MLLHVPLGLSTRTHRVAYTDVAHKFGVGLLNWILDVKTVLFWMADALMEMELFSFSKDMITGVPMAVCIMWR